MARRAMIVVAGVDLRAQSTYESLDLLEVLAELLVVGIELPSPLLSLVDQLADVVLGSGPQLLGITFRFVADLARLRGSRFECPHPGLGRLSSNSLCVLEGCTLESLGFLVSARATRWRTLPRSGGWS